MISVQDIRSLTDFQRHTKAHLKRLKSTGRPVVLTVNGRAELIESRRPSPLVEANILVPSAEQASYSISQSSRKIFVIHVAPELVDTQMLA